MVFQGCFNGHQMFQLLSNYHLIATRTQLGASISQCGSQWQASVFVAQVVFQCGPIIQKSLALSLEDHCHQPVWFHCSMPCGTPVTASGLEASRSGQFPACNSLYIQLVSPELFALSWFRLKCNPKYTKTILELITKHALSDVKELTRLKGWAGVHCQAINYK